MPTENNGVRQDIYEQLGRLEGGLDSVRLSVVELTTAIRGLPCGAHVARLDRIEAVLNGNLHRKPPTGASYPAVTQKDLDNTARMAIERAEETAFEEAHRAAKEAAVATLAAEKQAEADRVEKRRKSITWWLTTVQVILSLLGGGTIVAAVRYLALANEAIKANVSHQPPAHAPHPSSPQLSLPTPPSAP